jgi:outer membrane protein OmpA-like peptidoglycan-associated protein
MSDDNDDNKRVAMILVAAVVALVVAGVTTLGVFKARGAGHKAATVAAASAPAAEAASAPAAEPAATAAVAAAAAPADKLFFEVGADALPADAKDVLARVADAARANTAAVVQISGFHDASGDPAQNADLAKRRAFAVRDALVANGVPEAQIKLSKPAVTEGGADPREARRVELTVQ